MNWYEVKVKTKSEVAEAISEILVELGSNGTAIEDPNDPIFNGGEKGNWDYFDKDELFFEFEGAVVKGYFETDEIEDIIQVLEDALNKFKSFGINIEPGTVEANVVKEEDWANEWKKYFKPIRLGKNLLIKPTWEECEIKEEDILIEIDPGGAFGSGTHETTSMCMELIEKYMSGRSCELAYDIGCGSGILGVVEAKLGAKKVIAGDIDKAAVTTSVENAILNGVENVMVVKEGDLLSVSEGKADIIVANIIADIIIMMLDDLRTVMDKNSVFISSGIIDFKEGEVVEALKIKGYDVLEVMRKGSWVAVAAKLRG